MVSKPAAVLLAHKLSGTYADLAAVSHALYIRRFVVASVVFRSYTHTPEIFPIFPIFVSKHVRLSPSSSQYSFQSWKFVRINCIG